jgi:hypothetical protein
MSPMQSILALLGRHPKPWLAQKAWRERRIVSHGARGCFFALAIPFFGLPAFLALTFGMILMVEDPQEGVKALLVGTMFGGALAGVTWWWLNWKKFGKSVCHLETLPGVIGGWFKASVEVKMPAHVPPAIKVKLENFKIVGGRAPVKVTKWKTRELVPPDRFTRIQGDRYMVPVRFQIPAGEDYYRDWLLQIKAEFPGVNLRADFLVPIFETDEAPFVEQAPYSTGNQKNVEKTSWPDQSTFFNGQPQPEEDFGKLQDYTQLNEPLYDGSTTEVTEEEFSSFIGKNAENYIRKFRKFNVDGVDKFALTWNWPAFFFGFWWLLYRKLYVWALISFLLLIIPYWFFLSSFVYGAIANYIYYKHVKKKITQKKKAAASLVQQWPHSF